MWLFPGEASWVIGSIFAARSAGIVSDSIMDGEIKFMVI